MSPLPSSLSLSLVHRFKAKWCRASWKSQRMTCNYPCPLSPPLSRSLLCTNLRPSGEEHPQKVKWFFFTKVCTSPALSLVYKCKGSWWKALSNSQRMTYLVECVHPLLSYLCAGLRPVGEKQPQTAKGWHIYRVDQNHIYTVHIRYFFAGNSSNVRS